MQSVTPRLDGGAFLVTWSEFGHGGSDYAIIYGQRFELTGDPINPISSPDPAPISMSSDSGADKDYSRATALPGNGFAVLMLTHTVDDREAIYLSIFGDDGVQVGSDILVHSVGLGSYEHHMSIAPYAVAEVTDSFVVTYYTDDGVKGQFFDGTGNRLGNEFTTSNDAIGDDLASDNWQTLLGNRELVDLVQQTDGNGVTGIDYNLYAPNWQDINDTLESGNLVQAAPGEYIGGNTIFSLAGNDFVVAWGSGIDGPDQLYTQHFSVDANTGTLAGPPTDLILHGTSVAENAMGGIVGVLSGLDPDTAVADLSYSIVGGNTENYFEIVGNTLRLNSGTVFDFESQPTSGLDLTVEVSDGTGSLSENFTIAVENVIEAGEPYLEGVRWGNSRFVDSDTTPAEGSNPVIGSLPTGAYIGYSMIVNLDAGGNLDGRIYDQTGTETVANFEIFSGQTEGAISNPSIAGYGENFVVTWANEGSSVVHQQIYDYTGTALLSGDAELVAGPGYVPTGTPSAPVVSTGAGDYVVTWVEDNGVDGDGTGIMISEGNVIVNQSTAGNQSAPSIASFDNGDFVVVWQDDSGLDGDGSGIFGRYYDYATGTGFTDQFQINDTTWGDQVNPTVAANGLGSFMVSWTDLPGEGSGVYARVFDAAAPDFSADAEIHVADSMATQANQGVITMLNGNYLVYWDSVVYDNYSIRASLYAEDGTLLIKGDLSQVRPSSSSNVSVTALLNSPGDLAGTWDETDWQLGIPGEPYLFRSNATILTKIEGDDANNNYFGPVNASSILIGRGGDDTLTGGSEGDAIKGGTGMDTLIGNGGNDTFVIWGEFAADFYNDDPNTWQNESRDMTGESLIPGNSVSHWVAGETIDGGDGYDVIESYGTVNWGVADPHLNIPTITNVESYVSHSNVTFEVGQLAQFGFTTISGSGDEPHVLNFTGEGVVDLSGIVIENIDEINIDSSVELIMSQEQQETLTVQIAEANPDSADDQSTNEPLFGDAADEVPDEVESDEALVALESPADIDESEPLFGENPASGHSDDGSVNSVVAANNDETQSSSEEPLFGSLETGEETSAPLFEMDEPLVADVHDDTAMDLASDNPVADSGLEVEQPADLELIVIIDSVDDGGSAA